MATTADTVSVILKAIMVLTKRADTRLEVVLNNNTIVNHPVIRTLNPKF